MSNVNPSQRILALDILRGITIAGMILVNNPGTWNHIYAPLCHAEWNGLTPTDLVFPFFMFIMGISTYISLKKYRFTWSRETALKIVRRTLVIFVIGMAIGWFSRCCYYWASAPEELSFSQNLWASVWTFDRMRILGVMQRLALCYCAASLMALTLNHRLIPWITGLLLVGYGVVLLSCNGFVYGEENILSVIDRTLLTPAHMYRDHGIDPEGLLSTVPSIAHVLLGFSVGRMLFGPEANEARRGQDETSKGAGDAHTTLLVKFFLVGAVLTFSGLLLSYGCPINKKVWSPTFVLTTCGMASSLLGVLVWIIDVKGKRGWSRFFEAFGVNPLFMYVLGGVLSILLGSTGLHGRLYRDVLQPLLGNTAGSLAYALLFVALCWSIGYPLYKRRIYIKI